MASKSSSNKTPGASRKNSKDDSVVESISTSVTVASPLWLFVPSQNEWIPRFVALSSHWLLVYDEEGGELLYCDIVVNANIPGANFKKGRDGIFETDCSNGTFTFACNTAKERESWVIALIAAASSRKPILPVSPIAEALNKERARSRMLLDTVDDITKRYEKLETMVGDIHRKIPEERYAKERRLMQLHKAQGEQERLKQQYDEMKLERDELQLKLDTANRQDLAYARRAANEAVIELSKARETQTRQKWVETSHDRIVELSNSIRYNLEEDGATVIHRTADNSPVSQRSRVPRESHHNINRAIQELCSSSPSPRSQMVDDAPCRSRIIWTDVDNFKTSTSDAPSFTQKMFRPKMKLPTFM